ncbi:hypothetical protein ACI3PL_30350, partial [Lacticaseibacillus paracasei]
FDNCIRPEFAKESGIIGLIGIGGQDALYDSRDNIEPKNTSMGKYLIELEKRIPGKVQELLPHVLADAKAKQGFPEISLY